MVTMRPAGLIVSVSAPKDAVLCYVKLSGAQDITGCSGTVEIDTEARMLSSETIRTLIFF